MSLHKFDRLLIVNGIDPNRVKIINMVNKPEFSALVEFEGTTYKITKNGKEIIQPQNNTYTKNDVKKPRGWHFRDVFVDSEGNVYHKGIEQPELKGTLHESV